MNGGKNYVVGVLLVLLTACGGSTDEVLDGLAGTGVESADVVQTGQLLQKRLGAGVYDALPASLSSFRTETSRILIGNVAAIREGAGFVDIDESTLSEHVAGEETVLDQLPESQTVALIALLEAGELPSPVEVSFDSPLASWRTAELVVDVEFHINSEGSTLDEGQAEIVGVSFPSGADLGDLEGYRSLGRAAFFVDSSAVFGNEEGIQLNGALVAAVSEAGELTALPFLEHELVDGWLEDDPTVQSLADALAGSR